MRNWDTFIQKITDTMTELSDPTSIGRWFNAHVESSLLHAAMSQQLLQPLLIRPYNPHALATYLGKDPQAVYVVLQGLVGMGVLVINPDNQYQLAATCRAALDANGSAFIGPAVARAHQYWDAVAEDQSLAQLISLAESAIYDAHHDATWLIERAWAYVRTAAIMVLAESGVLALLQERPYSLDALTSVTPLKSTTLMPLLTAAQQCGMLFLGSKTVTLTEAAHNVLGKGIIANDKNWFSRRLWLERRFFWSPLGKLATCIHSGQPISNHSKPGENGAFRKTFIQINQPLLPFLERVANKVVGAFNVHSHPQNVLEIGAGLGNWGMAWAAAHEETQIMAVDAQEALNETQNIIIAANLDRQYNWQPCNILTFTPQPAQYDIVILNEVCHTLPPAHLPHWLKRITSSLKPGGLLLLADMILNDQKTGPLRHLLAGVKLLVSGGGYCVGINDYQAYLGQAGLHSSRLWRLPVTDLIAARQS